MGVPTFVGAGALAEGTAGIAAVNPNASHSSGDYELLLIETQDQTVSLTTAAGFTVHPGSPVSCASGTATVATRLTVYERIWNGSDGSPAVADSGNHDIAVILTFRRSTGTWSALSDVRSGTNHVGWEASPETTEDTSLSWTGLTTDTNDQLIIHLVAQAKPDIAGGTAEMSAHTNSNLTSITERFDDAAASGNGGWIGCWTGVKSSAGSTGTSTATGATASFHACLMIAIRDAASTDKPLDAQPGSYTIADGASATRVVAGRAVDAQPTSYALTGFTAFVGPGRVVSADPGVYTVTGFEAALIADRVLSGDFGVYLVTGFEAGLVLPGTNFPLDAQPGVYAVTGAAAALIADRMLSGDPATYTVAGAVAALIADRMIAVDPGVYAHTGFAAGLVHTVPGGGGPPPTRTLLGVGK